MGVRALVHFNGVQNGVLLISVDSAVNYMVRSPYLLEPPN
jgi:hypothetical protein